MYISSYATVNSIKRTYAGRLSVSLDCPRIQSEGRAQPIMGRDTDTLYYLWPRKLQF